MKPSRVLIFFCFLFPQVATPTLAGQLDTVTFAASIAYRLLGLEEVCHDRGETRPGQLRGQTQLATSSGFLCI